MKALLSALLCLTAIAQPAVAQSFLDKPRGAVRVMTWNIGANSIFPKAPEADTASVGRPEQFRRVIRALQPDVVCLQEVSSGALESAALLDELLPLADGGRWQSHGVLGNVIVSRFALRQRDQEVVTDGARPRGHAIALVDLPSGFPGDLYVLCAHLESGAGDDRVRLRELQARAMVTHIEGARAGRGATEFPPETTYVVLGDLNVIDEPASYMDVLRSAGLTDVLPRHNGVGPDFYTWRHDAQPYPPNALDPILFGGPTWASRTRSC